eukprot:11617605-Alexandrium_andersonii.AAC.1
MRSSSEESRDIGRIIPGGSEQRGRAREGARVQAHTGRRASSESGVTNPSCRKSTCARPS